MQNIFYQPIWPRVQFSPSKVSHQCILLLPLEGCKEVLKLGTSQMMENRLPDARELSYQHLMAGSVKHRLPAPPLPVEETRFL